MNNNVLSDISQRGDLLETVNGRERTFSQRISISEIGRNVLSSNLNSEIKKEKIEIKKTESKPEPKTAFGKFLKKLGDKIRKLFSSNGEFDLRDKVKEEYGDDIAQAIPDGKVSQKGLDGVRKILDQEIKSFASQIGYTFYKAKNGNLAHWEARPQSVSQTMKPTQNPRVAPQNPPARKSMYNSSPSINVKSNKEDLTPGIRDTSVAGTSTSQSGPENLLSVRLNESEQHDDRFLEALRKTGDSEGLQILTGFDIIRVIEGEEELTFKGYYYKNIKVYPKVVNGVLDGEKVTVVLKRFSHGKQAHETLKLDIPCSSLPESVKTKLSCVWSTRQEILSKRGPFGLFAILQETDEADGATSEGLRNYKENPEWLLRDMHIKAEAELYKALGPKTCSSFASVVDEKNKFPETPQEREKLVNEVFSELEEENSEIFNKGFSDEEIKQLIDMEISRNNLENGKSLCDNDFMYVASELQRPVLLQVGTKNDPSFVFFPPTEKSDDTILGVDRNAFKALQDSVRRFSKSELQDELCKDTEFLKSFKNAIFAEKVDDGQYINADQDFINSCQNMIAAGDVEAEKRAEAARKAEEARKAEKEAEAKAKALLPHVKLTNTEWKDFVFREVLKSAVGFQGLNVEGVIGKHVFLSKDGIQKGYSLEDIRIYPDSKDSKGAIIVMERFSHGKGKNETLELNVSRDALPKSIQSKLEKLDLSVDQKLANSAAGDVEAEKRAESARKAEEARKAEKEAEDKAKALPPHVKLTNAEWNNSAFREVLKSAVEFQGLNVEGVIGLNVFLSKDGIQKGYSFENIRIYPDPEDDDGAIIVMERFSHGKGENETLELNVSRDALPKSIQSKLDKLV